MTDRKGRYLKLLPAANSDASSKGDYAERSKPRIKTRNNIRIGGQSVQQEARSRLRFQQSSRVSSATRRDSSRSNGSALEKASNASCKTDEDKVRHPLEKDSQVQSLSKHLAKRNLSMQSFAVKVKRVPTVV